MVGLARPGSTAQQFADQLVGLAAGGAVADGDQLHLVLRDQARQFGLRAAHVVARLEADRPWRSPSTLPVPSTTATLTPVRMPGSRPMVAREPAGAASSRSLRLRGEHVDRLFLGALAQLGHQVHAQRERQLHAPAPAHHIHQPAVGQHHRRLDAMGHGDHALDGLVRGRILSFSFLRLQIIIHTIVALYYINLLYAIVQVFPEHFTARRILELRMTLPGIIYSRILQQQFFYITGILFIPGNRPGYAAGQHILIIPFMLLMGNATTGIMRRGHVNSSLNVLYRPPFSPLSMIAVAKDI